MEFQKPIFSKKFNPNEKITFISDFSKKYILAGGKILNQGIKIHLINKETLQSEATIFHKNILSLNSDIVNVICEKSNMFIWTNNGEFLKISFQKTLLGDYDLLS